MLLDTNFLKYYTVNNFTSIVFVDYDPNNSCIMYCASSLKTR